MPGTEHPNTCPENLPHAFDYDAVDDACCENPVADGKVRKNGLFFENQNLIYNKYNLNKNYSLDADG